MKMTVIGLGLIGSQVVRKLTAAGHEVVPAARFHRRRSDHGEGRG